MNARKDTITAESQLIITINAVMNVCNQCFDSIGVQISCNIFTIKKSNK